MCRVERRKASTGLLLPNGLPLLKTPHGPGRDFLRAALQTEALPTQFSFHVALHPQDLRFNLLSKALSPSPANFPFILHRQDRWMDR